jgi:hypothetical protein
MRSIHEMMVLKSFNQLILNPHFLKLSSKKISGVFLFSPHHPIRTLRKTGIHHLLKELLRIIKLCPLFS